MINYAGGSDISVSRYAVVQTKQNKLKSLIVALEKQPLMRLKQMVGTMYIKQYVHPTDCIKPITIIACITNFVQASAWLANMSEFVYLPTATLRHQRFRPVHTGILPLPSVRCSLCLQGVNESNASSRSQQKAPSTFCGMRANSDREIAPLFNM